MISFDKRYLILLLLIGQAQAGGAAPTLVYNQTTTGVGL